jgi:hypothetical protein
MSNKEILKLLLLISPIFLIQIGLAVYALAALGLGAGFDRDRFQHSDRYYRLRDLPSLGTSRGII